MVQETPFRVCDSAENTKELTFQVKLIICKLVTFLIVPSESQNFTACYTRFPFTFYKLHTEKNPCLECCTIKSSYEKHDIKFYFYLVNFF